MPNDYEATFDAIDVDQDGLITADEFKTLMTTLGQTMTDETANAMLALIDGDGDGRVTRAELVAYLTKA